MTKEKIPQIKAKPVFSVDAEAAVLGSLILKNELFDEVSTLIYADDFFNYTHKVIFEGIVHLLQLGKPVDILTLEQYFTDKSLIDEFGLGYLAQIVNNTPSSSNIVAYAKVIARHSKQRRFTTLPLHMIRDKASSSGGTFLRWRSFQASKNGGSVLTPIFNNARIPLELRQKLVSAEKERILINLQVSVLNFMMRQVSSAGEKIKEIENS